MINLQNPSIPIQQDPVEIDGVIIDLQTVLSNSLPWLTQPYGRAYKNLDVSNGTRLYYPQVYLGKDRLEPKYLTITPDNDKEGQCFFYVEREVLTEQQQGQYGFLNYNLSIIFSVNLQLINSTLLETDLFTANLVKDVREVLRQNLGKEYQLTVTTVDYLIERVFSGFNVEIQTIEKAPLQHFRLNATVLLPEDCSDLPYNACDVLLGNLTEDQKNNCILPTYDFSNPVVQSATTGQQQSDLTSWLCTLPEPTAKSFILNGVNEHIVFPLNAAYEFEYNTPFTLSCWVKFDTLKTANLFNKYSTAGADRGYFLIALANGALRMDLQNDGGIMGLSVTTPSSTVNIAQWYHIAMTYGGSPLPNSIKIYVNGVPIGLTTLNNTLGNNTIKNNSIPLRIGTNDTLLNGIDGLISDCLIWDSELIQADVTSEYNRKLTGTPAQSGNLAAWIKGATNSQFGVDTFTQADSSNTIIGVKTVNIESNETSLDVPI